MRYAIKVKDQELKEKFKKGIIRIFPNITPSSPDLIIERNSPGVIIVDHDNLSEILKSVRLKENGDKRNYFLVVITNKGQEPHDHADLAIDRIDERFFKILQDKLHQKMEQLTLKKFQEIPDRLLKIYEELGCGLLIVDRKLKIVYANKKAINLFKNKFTQSELLNMNLEKILELLPNSRNREFVKDAIINASEISLDVDLSTGEELTNLHLSTFPRYKKTGDFDGAFISFEEITNAGVSQKLWERTNNLIERLEEIIPEIGQNFFDSIGEILKSFASINKLKTLIFVPLIFRKLDDHSEVPPLIFIYKSKEGKYKYSITFSPDVVNNVISLFETNSYNISKFYEIFKKPEDIEAYDKNIISLNHPLVCNGETIGLLLMERVTPPLREEKFFTKWFEKELTLLMIKAVAESPSKLVNFIESIIGSTQKTAIVIVNDEGTILRANKKFYDLFDVSIKSPLEGNPLSGIYWLNTHPEIVDKILEYVREKKPYFNSKWISISPTNEKFIEITGIPIKTDLILTDKNYYVWMFEDMTDTKMAEIRRDFVQNVLKRKMQIYEEISAILRGGRYDKYEEFLLKAPKIVCENLSFICEGVIFFIKNFAIHGSRGEPCTVCGRLKEIIGEKDVCYLVNQIDRIRMDNGIVSEPSIITPNNLKSFNEFQSRGYDDILVIPISLQGISLPIGHILLFSKKQSIFWRILKRLPKMVPLSSAQFEEVDLFVQFAEKVSTYLQIVKKEAEMIEKERFAEEIYNHVEDIVLIESFDGKIEFVNRRAEDFYGYPREALIGKSVDILIPENIRDLKDKIQQELREKGEFSIIAPNTDSLGNLKWLNFNFRVVQFGGVNKVLVVGHDITELRENLKTLNDMLVGIMSALFNILENRSTALKKHSINVAYIAGEIAKKLKNQKEFSTERQILCLILAGLLHDIGKINVPSTILAQPKEELIKIPHKYRLYTFHPKTGAEIIKSIPLPCRDLISKWIEQHHEKLDGSGFPMGKQLKPEEITLGARIIAVANEFENEIISKPMHKVKSPDEVFDRFMNSGEFDKTVVKALIELYNEDIVNKLVEKDEEADRKIKEIFNFLTGIYGERQNLEEYR